MLVLQKRFVEFKTKNKFLNYLAMMNESNTLTVDSKFGVDFNLYR